MAAEGRRGSGECVENSDIKKKGIWGGTLKFSRENNFSWKSLSSSSKDVTPLHWESVTLAFLCSMIHSFVIFSIFLYKYSANTSERSQFLHREELSLARNLLLLIHIQRSPEGAIKTILRVNYPPRKGLQDPGPAQDPQLDQHMSVFDKGLCW